MNSTNFNIGKIAKRLGYIQDQQGIYARYLREKVNWFPHLKKSKSLILDAIRKSEEHNIIILGSGWLFDFPVDELLNSELIKQITLVDIHHPKEIIKKYNHPKLNFIETDITGIAHDIYNQTKGLKLKHAIDLKSLDFKYDFTTETGKGFFVSLNLLDQLNTLITEFLERKNIQNQNLIKELNHQIQKNHIHQLLKHSFCITYGLKELHYKKDKLVNEFPVSFIDEIFHPQKSWIWKFDTQGYYLPKTKVFYKTGFYTNQ